jgi:site-specific DNA recombinase
MPAAVYVRISSDPSGLRAGVERQERDCRELAERRGWTVAQVYCDNDVSADSGRPAPPISSSSPTSRLAWWTR